MALKYDPLSRLLRSRTPEPVTLTFAELDVLIGGLPPSARTTRSWWGNTVSTHQSQAHAWMEADYRVGGLELGGTVTFLAGNGHVAGKRRVARQVQRAEPILDGVDELAALIARAGYPSVVAAVAEHAVFLHPETVAHTNGEALFPIARDQNRRGEFGETPDGRRVLLDDNESPVLAFLWASGRPRGRDVQFNHVWDDSRDPGFYTALWNLVATPSFLAKTTDGKNHPEVVNALRYRALDLYARWPEALPRPERPVGYDALRWAAHPEPIAGLIEVLRARLRVKPRSRTTRACRELGWLGSGWRPDSSL